MKKRSQRKMPFSILVLISFVIVLSACFIPITYGQYLSDFIGKCTLLSMPEELYVQIKNYKDSFILQINTQAENIDLFQRYGNISQIEQKRQFRNLAITPDDIKENEALMRDSFAQTYDENGTVTEKTYISYQATDSAENVYLRNVTVDSDIDVAEILANGCTLPVNDFLQPTVLIYHTHSTECYNPCDNGKFATAFPERNENTSVNVVRVGEEIAAVLRARGIGVIHDTTIYDTVYTGAYEKSRAGVTEILEKYPSIVITLDVHRDAIHYDDTTRVKPIAEIDGMKAAQIMFIAGAEGGNVDSFSSWETNISFAINLNKKVNNKYENLMKPIYFCNRKYNMDLTPYSLLAEIGTDMNTLSEAAYSGRLLGDALAEFIKENVKSD